VHKHTLLICVVCTEYGSYVVKITFVVKLAHIEETVPVGIFYYLTCVMCFECHVAMLTQLIGLLLTLWSRILKKLSGFQLVKKFP